MSEKKTKLNRRNFLELAALSVPAVSILSACGLPPNSANPGVPANADSNAQKTPNDKEPSNSFTFAKHPEIQNPGGSIRATIQTSNGPKEVYVTRVDANSATAVSIICTHQGCVLNTYDATKKQYHCPCHGSIFSAEGNVVAGPAKVRLASYQATVSVSDIQVSAG